MNNGPQGSQPSQGQPSGGQQQGQQQRPPMRMFKPEQMRNLPPPFTAEEKAKWEQGLRQLWTQIERNAPDTAPHQEAKRKLFDFSKTLHSKLAQGTQAAAQRAQQAAAQGQAGGPSGARPAGAPQQQQAQGGEGSGANPNAGQQQRPQQKISPKIMEHVSTFPYVPPANIVAGSADEAKWIHEAKSKYLKALVAMETGASRVSQLEAILQRRNEEGKPLTPDEERDYKEKREQAAKTNTEAKAYVDNFRQSQLQARNAQNQNASNQQGNQSNTMGGNAQSSQGPTRPQLNPQQQTVPNPAMQNTQTINNAIEAAKNQQMGGGRGSIGNGQMGQPNQMPNAQHMAAQQGGQAPIKAEGGVPHINTAVSQMQANQNRPMQNNSPQSAVPRSAAPQSATTQQSQVPQALSHQDALGIAARSYSNQPVPSVMGHSHPQNISQAKEPNPTVITNKMPIPKHLPERATAPPQPVQISQSRPTYNGGPSSAGNGVLGQPVIAKTPGYSMEGEGDRVLSKKKLDELVRQVTGGGQGLEGGEGLTPEVEESILNVADNFVDQVLQAACKHAKERGSKLLEIRDIQLTLERGYNIRIPGYSSDEIRTVRKIQPAPNWIAKMSAVQAAKVTGGKNND